MEDKAPSRNGECPVCGGAAFESLLDHFMTLGPLERVDCHTCGAPVRLRWSFLPTLTAGATLWAAQEILLLLVGEPNIVTWGGSIALAVAASAPLHLRVPLVKRRNRRG